jgi:hypothetical protein
MRWASVTFPTVRAAAMGPTASAVLAALRHANNTAADGRARIATAIGVAPHKSARLQHQ